MLLVDGLEVRYGGIRAVRAVSLKAGSGQIVGVVGPNGAGKSSLLRAVVGAVRPAAGEVTWNGRRLTGFRPHQLVRAGVVLVPEGRGLLRSLTVAENLAVAAFSGRTGDDGIARDEVLGLFPVLGDRLAQPAGSLSGGEQQMLVIARALLMRPELLLIDELSLGLAPRVVAQVYDVLRRRNAEGLTIVVVEQHLAQVVSVAHELYALARGEVVAAGPPADVAATLTRSFGGAVPGRRAVVARSLEEVG
ncbi:MAG: ABC transporter ATP-binding protein [Actinomycetota bacterium]|jgi:branched-chain amino acid transport system ATP-binding protein